MKPTNLAKIFIVLAVGGTVVLLPLRTPAQTSLSENLFCTSNANGDGDAYASPSATTDTNSLTSAISVGSDIGIASYNATATYGAVQVAGSAYAYGPDVETNYGVAEFYSVTSGAPQARFGDVFTVTSPTLASGTPVQVRVTCLVTGLATENSSGTGPLDGSGVSAYNQFDEFESYQFSFQTYMTGALNTNTLVGTVITSVGQVFGIEDEIFTSGSANSEGGSPSSANSDQPMSQSISINSSVTAKVYVDVLTPGAGYQTQSDTLYPTLIPPPPPLLSIQSAGNQSVVISWLANYTNCVLMQSQSLAPANWVLTTNNISAVNGTNQVTINSATDTMFFQLGHP
jgi:hypothetical protein